MQPLKYQIKMTQEQAKQLRDFFPVLMLIWLGILTLQCWKPGFYWDDNLIVKILITFFGQRLTDILGYIGVLWLLFGFILLRQEAEKMRN